MTRVLHRPRLDEAALLAPLAKHAPAARHLTGIKRIDNAPLDFSDLRDDPDTCPDWAVPATLEENLDAIRAFVDQAPFVKHEDAVAMVLEPLAALLAEPADPGADPADKLTMTTVETGLIEALGWLTTSTTEALDRIHNADVWAWHQITAPVEHEAKWLQLELVEDYATALAEQIAEAWL